jgi:hypothetical protein
LKRYLSFDIETAKILPSEAKDILQHRPLGIACATAVAEDDSANTFRWHGWDADRRPAKQMSPKEAEQLVMDLMELSAKGYTLLTWGGAGFDFDVLAEESGRVNECAALAKNHVDMLFHVLCSLGFPVSLQKASEGMKLPGKKAGVSGALAPTMWAAGQFEDVINYCIQDVHLTLQVAKKCELSRQLTWITQRGQAKQLGLPNGWLTVEAACQLPLPDTSWMTDPMLRDDVVRWLSKTV